MKPLLPPLACGALVAALLYGLLWAAERKLPESEDPWLDAWVGEGMKADFRASSTEPKSHLLATDAREFFDKDVEGTVLRNYYIQDTAVQIVLLPKATMVPAIPEGRHLDYRFKPKGNTVHVCRSGRRLALIASMGKPVALFIPGQKTPKDLVQRIFDAFEETAARYP